MIKNKYLVQEPSKTDNRSSKIRLSDKGIELRDKLDSVFEKYSEKILDYCISSKNIMKEIGELEHFWSQVLKNKRGHQYGT
jgi:DNA-binding MarR family transcriptional regulator